MAKMFHVKHFWGGRNLEDWQEKFANQKIMRTFAFTIHIIINQNIYNNGKN